MNKTVDYPRLRYMGSKSRLIPWIVDILSKLDFEVALDCFSGSGAVGYVLKGLGKQVYSNDFLNFSYRIAHGVIENNSWQIGEGDLQFLLQNPGPKQAFIRETFDGIFFTTEDLVFLDKVRGNIDCLENEYLKSIAISALVRSCLKRQPRGVFTVSGDLSNYDDGRRDLRLSLKEHFVEQIEIYNSIIFDNGKVNKAFCSDVFDLPDSIEADLVYMDPPYVPRADDNCYVKRYHFVEGLSAYWRDMEIMENSKVRKIKKKFTPFSYRKRAIEAFSKMFFKFRNSQLLLSYSSNGYPDLDTLVELMKKFKDEVTVFEKDHTYHFGTHAKVKRSKTKEYLILGQ